MPSELLLNLQRWYCSHCDGEWEHSFGVSIDTLDNPGWRLKVDIVGTDLLGREFTELHGNLDTAAWIHCFVRDGAFMAHGGPTMLGDMISVFLEWAR